MQDIGTLIKIFQMNFNEEEIETFKFWLSGYMSALHRAKIIEKEQIAYLIVKLEQLVESIKENYEDDFKKLIFEDERLVDIISNNKVHGEKDYELLFDENEVLDEKMLDIDEIFGDVSDVE